LSRSKSKLVKIYLSKKLNYFLKVIEVKVEDKVYCNTKNNEKNAKEMLPDVNYKAGTTRRRIRQKVPNDGDAPEVYLNVRDKFCITTFYTIVDKLATELKRRDIQRNSRDFLSDVPYNATLSSTSTERYSRCCQKPIDAYPEDFNSNSSADLQQFHLCAP